ncbi:MAG: TetR/AcrR family transcriptional regulator [Pseudoxanthomonas suwonensis]|nr:TetR/AcrR family transcriptional regulator [Pseudoxanthomonas suwonensis]
MIPRLPERSRPAPGSACAADATDASPPRAASPGRPKDLSKGQAILDSARRLFLEHGFEGVSMDQIAAAAGVSKLTVYNHYGDKETLFGEAVRSYCEQGFPDAVFQDDPAQPLQAALLAIARRYFDFVCAPDAIAGHRLLCSPQMADTPVSRLFWTSGPQHIQERMAALLLHRAGHGQLQVDDPCRAASQFFALVRGDPHSRLLFGCDVCTSEEIAAHLQASVAMFLRAYAPSGPTR